MSNNFNPRCYTSGPSSQTRHFDIKDGTKNFRRDSPVSQLNRRNQLYSNQNLKPNFSSYRNYNSFNSNIHNNSKPEFVSFKTRIKDLEGPSISIQKLISGNPHEIKILNWIFKF